jgi:hypothetical protein
LSNPWCYGAGMTIKCEVRNGRKGVNKRRGRLRGRASRYGGQASIPSRRGKTRRNSAASGNLFPLFTPSGGPWSSNVEPGAENSKGAKSVPERALKGALVRLCPPLPAFARLCPALPAFLWAGGQAHCQCQMTNIQTKQARFVRLRSLALAFFRFRSLSSASARLAVGGLGKERAAAAAFRGSIHLWQKARAKDSSKTASGEGSQYQSGLHPIEKASLRVYPVNVKNVFR